MTASRPQARGLAVVVLGMHRSGTSALAGALARLGLGLPRDLMPAQSDNPRGFYEAVGVAELNDRILDDLGGAWDRPPDVIPPSTVETYLPAAEAVLKESFGEIRAILLKDPRIALLRPLWDRALRRLGYDPHYVLVHRNPLDVAASLATRNGLSQEQSLGLWLSYVLAALDVEREGRLSAVVGYEELLDQPRFLLTSVGAALGLQPGPNEIGSAVALLDAAERHQQAGKWQFDEDPSVPDLVKEAWWLLRRWHTHEPARRRAAIARFMDQADGAGGFDEARSARRN